MVQGSQIFKQNWIILIRSRVIVILLIWVSLALGVGQVGAGCLGWSTIVYMSSGMFRGKESSNRIELSRLVQDLLNFADLGSLQLWGGGRWVGGVLGNGGCPHMHACTHTHAHVYMYRNCKWPPTWRHPCLACLSWTTCMSMHVCMSVHACVHGTPPTHPYPPHPPSTHPPPPRGWTPRISKNSITLELIKIFQFHLKIWNLWRIPHPWVGVWFGGWVGLGWWVGSGQNTKNLKNVDWIKIIQFYLKIYDL